MRFFLRCVAIAGGPALLSDLIGEHGLLLAHPVVIAALSVLWAASVPEFEKRLMKES